MSLTDQKLEAALEQLATLRADLARVTAERDVSRLLHEQDRENYQCATKAGMAVEAQLRAVAESATPTKHPDTERLEAIASMDAEVFHTPGVGWCVCTDDGDFYADTLTEAIDAARAESAAVDAARKR